MQPLAGSEIVNKVYSGVTGKIHYSLLFSDINLYDVDDEAGVISFGVCSGL